MQTVADIKGGKGVKHPQVPSSWGIFGKGSGTKVKYKAFNKKIAFPETQFHANSSYEKHMYTIKTPNYLLSIHASFTILRKFRTFAPPNFLEKLPLVANNENNETIDKAIMNISLWKNESWCTKQHI